MAKQKRKDVSSPENLLKIPSIAQEPGVVLEGFRFASVPDQNTCRGNTFQSVLR